MNKNCIFKLASEENYKDYYEIRSEESNLYWTGYEKAPDFNSFFNWYKNRISDNKKKIYLIYSNDTCIGSLNIDFYSNYTFIGYSVKEQFEGKGFATCIVSKSIKIIQENNTILKVKAWINAKNIGSLKVAEKNGFVITNVSENRLRFGQEEKYLLLELDLK